MSFPKRSVAAPCLCIKSGIIWTCDWCIPVVPHPNNRTCTHYTGDRRASNVRFCLGASGRKANIQAESRTTVSFLVSTNRYEHHPRPILKPDYYLEPINERLDASGTLQIRI